MSTLTARAPASPVQQRVRRPAAAVPRPRPRVPAARLTRRGRVLRSLLLGLLLVTAVMVAVVAWGSGVVATSGGGRPVPVRTVTVQPGQTLWDIAADSGLDGDPRSVVARIQDLNALSDPGRLQVGQSLAVPLR